MNKFTTFLLGMVVGAAALFLSENYYVVRAESGVRLVPKIAAKIEFPYRDIRGYTVDDWNNNHSLGLAIVQSQQEDLMVDSLSPVKQKFDSILKSLGGN